MRTSLSPPPPPPPPRPPPRPLRALAAELNSHLASSLFTSDELTSKILTFKQKAPRPHEGHQSHLRVLYTQNRDVPVARKVAHRHIATAPERVLDAPNMSDDYYLNLIDWSVHNTLAVALGAEVYLWDAASGSIDLLCELGQADSVTSVQWMADGSHLAVGTSSSAQRRAAVERRRQEAGALHEGPRGARGRAGLERPPAEQRQPGQRHHPPRRPHRQARGQHTARPRAGDLRAEVER